MQAAIIPADPASPVRYEDIDPATAMSGLVGGDFEVIGVRGTGMNMYLNENGKLEALAVNPRATILCRSTGTLGEDFICGDAVLLGPIDDDGDDTGLSTAQQQWLASFEAGISGTGA